VAGWFFFMSDNLGRVDGLLQMLHDAARGRFPDVDGEVTFLGPLDAGLEAVVSFTGHAVIASRFGADAFFDLAPNGFGSALDPRLLLRMAGDGEVGMIDVTLVSFGSGVDALRPACDLDDHPRVAHARSLRSSVSVFADSDGLVTIGRGLAGRTEVSVELFGDRHGNGLGRRLIESAVGNVPEGQPVFAAVSPGNARSLRAFLAAGFVPIGSEVIVRPIT